MQIVIGSDHAGFSLKQVLIPFLLEEGHTIKDMGPDCDDNCDYPYFAGLVCAEVLEKNALGVLICGTGIGMSMAANREYGIRAALCTTEFHAKYARLHNNSNILCLGERVTGAGLAREILRTFLSTEFEGGRHSKRLEMFNNG